MLGDTLVETAYAVRSTCSVFAHILKHKYVRHVAREERANAKKYPRALIFPPYLHGAPIEGGHLPFENGEREPSGIEINR